MRRCDGATVRGATVRSAQSFPILGGDGIAIIATSGDAWSGFSGQFTWRTACNYPAVAGARHFTELDCWKLADELKLALYRLSNRGAVQRDLKYREELREAAASAPRNISEGFGRRTNVDFARFLDIARGSLMECQNHLKDGVDRGHLDSTESAALITLAKRASGAVAALQRHLRRRPPN